MLRPVPRRNHWQAAPFQRTRRAGELLRVLVKVSPGVPMAQRKAKPSTEGDGELRVGSDTQAVRYCIEGDPATLRPGIYRMRGAVACRDAEAAAEAFRKGEGMLRLADGSM